jgi:hypothetical protein
MRREVDDHVVRQVSRHDRQSCVIYSRLDSRTADKTISEQLAHFRELGHDFEWKVFAHDQPADLKDRLVARGFELEETEAILALELEMLPPCLARQAKHDIRRITEPKDLKDFAAVRNAVWGEDTTGQDERLARELHEQPARTRIYVAYVEGIPASIGRLNLDRNSRFASLWGGTTRPEYRGLGLYSAIIGVRAREARDCGTQFLTVDAQPMSQPILERAGFRLLTLANALHWKNPELQPR